MLDNIHLCMYITTNYKAHCAITKKPYNNNVGKLFNYSMNNK